MLGYRAFFLSELRRGSEARRAVDAGLQLLARAEASGFDTRSGEAFLLQAAADPDRQAGRPGVRQLYERSLSLAQAAGDRWQTAATLGSLADLDIWNAEYDEATRKLQACIEIGRDLGDERWIAGATIWLAFIHVQRGEVVEGERLARETLPMLRSTGCPRDLAAGLLVLAGALAYGGKFAAAQQLLEERQATFDELGIEHAFGLAMLGWIELLQGEYEQAIPHLRTALAIAREQGGSLVTALSQLELGRIALRDGAYGEARRLAAESISGFDGYGLRDYVARSRAAASQAALGLRDLDDARSELKLVLRWATERGSYLALVEALPAAASLLLDQGDAERAVEVYALARTLPMVARSPWYREVIGRPIANAARLLPPAIAGAAEERGRARDLQATCRELAEEFEKMDA
jgi:tetratricopeptide (TPR) repeat protein